MIIDDVLAMCAHVLEGTKIEGSSQSWELVLETQPPSRSSHAITLRFINLS